MCLRQTLPSPILGSLSLPQPQAQRWPCFCLELVACSGGSLTSRFLSLSLSNGGKIIIFTEWSWRHLPPRRFLLVPHPQTSKSVDFPNQTTFVAQAGPLAVHCSSWTSSPPCKHAVTTSIQNTVGQRPDLKDILVQVKRASTFFAGLWGVLTEETKFVDLAHNIKPKLCTKHVLTVREWFQMDFKKTFEHLSRKENSSQPLCFSKW